LPERLPDLELPASAEPSGPPLVVLVPRAGVTSFDVHAFVDGKSAREFLQSLRSAFGLPNGLLAFWALQDPPLELRDAIEPVALIRDPAKPSIACPYFFVDTYATQSYVGTKLQQGMDPASVEIYLALIVGVDEDEQGAVSLSPAHPPYVRRPERSGRARAGYELGRGEEPSGIPAGQPRPASPATERFPG
jgi:hypothetical protein